MLVAFYNEENLKKQSFEKINFFLLSFPKNFNEIMFCFPCFFFILITVAKEKCFKLRNATCASLTIVFLFEKECKTKTRKSDVSSEQFNRLFS